MPCIWLRSIHEFGTKLNFVRVYDHFPQTRVYMILEREQEYPEMWMFRWRTHQVKR